jgi:hypothetical protein
VAEPVVKPAGIATGFSGLERAQIEVVGIRSVLAEKKKKRNKEAWSIDHIAS